MGHQTCVVMIGFIALHIASILSIVSLSTPEWASAHAPNGSVKANRTNHCDVGLWEICCNYQECHRLNGTIQPASFKATTAMTIIGTSSLVLATFLMYVFLFGERMKTSVNCAAVIVFVALIGAFSLLTAIIIFGIKYDDLKQYPESYISELGYSYWVGVAATSVAFVALIADSSLVCLMRRRQVGLYEDL